MVTVLRELYSTHKQPTHEDKEAAAQSLASIIDQARSLGHTYAMQQLERGIISKSLLVGALLVSWEIINHFVQRVADWIAGKEADEDEEDLTEEAIILTIASLADRVAGYEVHAAIEQEVLSTLQSQGVGMVVCIAQPGACALCLANVDAGPIPIGTAFPSGDKAAPFHGYCRCNVVAA